MDGKEGGEEKGRAGIELGLERRMREKGKMGEERIRLFTR